MFCFRRCICLTRAAFPVVFFLMGSAVFEAAAATVPREFSDERDLASQNQGFLFRTEDVLTGLRSTTSGESRFATPDDVIARKTDLSTTWVAARRIHYREGRYMHQNLPYFFIPFNHRISHWLIGGDFTRYTSKVETRHLFSGVPVPTEVVESTAKAYSATIASRDYSNQVCLGGSASVARVEPGQDEARLLQDYQFELGFYDAEFQGGIHLQSAVSDLVGFRENILTTAYGVYTPAPYLLFRGSFGIYVNTNLENANNAMFETVYFSPGTWWQMGVLGVIETMDGGDENDFYSVHLGKHWKSLFVKGSYSRTKWGDSDIGGTVSGVSGTIQFRSAEGTYLTVSLAHTFQEGDDPLVGISQMYFSDWKGDYSRDDAENALHVRVSRPF